MNWYIIIYKYIIIIVIYSYSILLLYEFIFYMGFYCWLNFSLILYFLFIFTITNVHFFLFKQNRLLARTTRRDGSNNRRGNSSQQMRKRTNEQEEQTTGARKRRMAHRITKSTRGSTRGKRGSGKMNRSPQLVPARSRPTPRSCWEAATMLLPRTRNCHRRGAGREKKEKKIIVKFVYNKKN